MWLSLIIMEYLSKQDSSNMVWFISFSYFLQLKYGQRFTEGTGSIDGEGMERLWAYERGFSGPSKEMSLSNRRDLLTDGLLNFRRRSFYTLGNILFNICYSALDQSVGVQWLGRSPPRPKVRGSIPGRCRS